MRSSLLAVFALLAFVQISRAETPPAANRFEREIIAYMKAHKIKQLIV